MISNLTYTSGGFYISNEVKLVPLSSFSDLGTTCLYIKDLYYLINTQNFTKFI